jgi:broad specificity phosphatase PhoE
MTETATATAKPRITFDHPTVLLFRHGKTAFNTGTEEDRLKGTRYNLPLDAEGKREVQRDARILGKYDLVGLDHSALLRARQTAEAIAEETGLTPTSYEGLDPWDVGYLSGQRRSVADARIRYYIQHPHKPVPPDGQAYEDWYAVYSRTLRGALRKAEGARAPGQSDQYRGRVLVTHSCGILATPHIIRGHEPEAVEPHTGKVPGPAHLIALAKKNGRWTVEWEPEL